MLNDNGLERIKRNTCFQWYDLTRLTTDIQTALDANLTLVNLFPAPLWTEELISLLKETRIVSNAIIAKIPTVKSTPDLLYKIYTRNGQIFNGYETYIYDVETSKNNIKNYFYSEISKRKITFSNIAWDNQDQDENETVLETLKGRINQIEVGPTKIWGSWKNAKLALKNGDAKAFGKLILF